MGAVNTSTIPPLRDSSRVDHPSSGGYAHRVRRALLLGIVLGVRLALADEADDEVLESRHPTDGIPERSRVLEREWEHDGEAVEPDADAEPADEAPEPAAPDDAEDEHPTTTSLPADAHDAAPKRAPRGRPKLLESPLRDGRRADPGPTSRPDSAVRPRAPSAEEE